MVPAVVKLTVSAPGALMVVKPPYCAAVMVTEALLAILTVSKPLTLAALILLPLTRYSASLVPAPATNVPV